MSALQDLLVDEMKDLLHAEAQLAKALPKMAKAAHNPKLKQAFTKHLEETKVHADRLKQAFELLGEKPKAKPCKAMMGLIEEGSDAMEEGKEKDEAVADLALVASAQKIEHYEICGYGTLRTIADEIGNKKVSKLLSQTLAEETKTDELLTKLSPPLLKAANQAPEEEESEEEHEEEEEPIEV